MKPDTQPNPPPEPEAKGGHTPTPREVYRHPSGGAAIKSVNGYPGDPQSALWPVHLLGRGPHEDANAEFIVRAANSHADLLAACEALLEGAHVLAMGGRIKVKVLDDARAAIAKAKEGRP